MSSLSADEHLAAVAHAESEGRVALEERRELVAGDRIEQNRLRPALAGTEHIAVGKSAAGDQSVEPRQAHAGRARMSVMCTS